MYFVQNTTATLFMQPLPVTAHAIPCIISVDARQRLEGHLNCMRLSYGRVQSFPQQHIKFTTGVSGIMRNSR